VSDGDGDELYFSPVLLEGRDEGRLFLGLLCEFVIASEVSAKFDFYEDECEPHLVDIVQIRVGGGWNYFGVDDVWRCAVSILEEFLGLVRREYPWWYPGGGLRTLRIPLGGREAHVGVSHVPGDVRVALVAGFFF